MKMQNEYLLRSQLNLQKIIGVDLNKLDAATLKNKETFPKTPAAKKGAFDLKSPLKNGK